MILPDFQSLVNSLSDQNQSRAFFSESGNARRDGDLCGWKEIPDFCAGGEVNSMWSGNDRTRCQKNNAPVPFIH